MLGEQAIESKETIRELSAEEVDAVGGAWIFENGDFQLAQGGWGSQISYAGWGFGYSTYGNRWYIL